MEYLLLILSLIFIILGYVGAFVPGLSGPPLAWVAILLIYFINNIQLPLWVLIVTGVIAGLSLILEWIIPAYGTKIFKGSKYGIRGSYIGMIIGIIAPIPFGFLIGPFVGAYVGELYMDPKDQSRALKAAFGTFIGFLLAILMNFALVSLMLLVWGYYVFKMFFTLNNSH
jgi:uncharacterized protein YqgC (DUF456 family)